MIDGFQGLRHHAVVGGHHQDDDIGDFGAAGAHAGECLVTGRVDEYDLAAVLFDVIRADVLRNTAGLAVGDMRGADCIQQRRFPMIDVAHDGHHRGTLHPIGGLFGLRDLLRALFFVADLISGSSELARQVLGHLDVKVLIDGGENLLLHQLFDYQVGLDAEFFGKLLDGDAFRNGNFTIDGRRRGGLLAAHRHPQPALFLFLIAMPVAADRLALMAALLFGWDRSRGLGAQRGRRMQSARPPKASWRCSGSWGAGAHSGPAHNGLARANRTAVDGLAGNECRTAGWQSRPRRLRLYLTGTRTCLLQPCHHVGTRRNHGTRCGLPRQIMTRLRPQGGPWSWHSRLDWHRRRRGFGRRGSAGWRSGPRHWSSRNRNGRGRHGRRGGSRRYGLSWSRQDLTGPRRRNGTGRNRTGAQRGMQRSRATRGQGRPQGRRLTAERFFNDGNGGLLGSGWDG